MLQRGANEYLKSKVFTATPEQLQMMLYDGAIRFCEQGKLALKDKKFEQSYHALSKAQKIIIELQSSLKKDVAPDLCANLAGLYSFCYRKIVQANTAHDVLALDEAIGILKYQRDTWAMLMEQLGKSNAARAAARIDMPTPSAAMEQRISLQG